MFVHEERDFDALLGIVATKLGLSRGLVEKDYWVTHTLWALHRQGLEVWFKGGTSLSKGFRLIQRFSEDLDLKIEPGTFAALPAVTDWRREGTKVVQGRKDYFQALGTALDVPGARIVLEPCEPKHTWRHANLRVEYPVRHGADLPGVMSPFVLLEVGSARVTPSVACDMTSFVHDELSAQHQLSDFEDNRPTGVRCVHPLVTLLEKLDAMQKRVPNHAAAAATFVRHFEDAAQIILAQETLPPLDEYGSIQALVDEMVAEKQLIAAPNAGHPSFALDPGTRTDEIRDAHAAIAPMFWGPRMSLEKACAIIRTWLTETLRTRA